MTAEISISNKHAVALAADSAVTIGRGEKVFTSVNKIFCLSEKHPVGFMIYGGASFLGISWEIIIGAYRRKIGDKTFDTFKEYGDDFIRFLTTDPFLFPLPQQSFEFEFIAGSYLHQLLREVEGSAKEFHSRHGKITDADIKQITKTIIDSHFASWDSAKYIKGANNSKLKKLLKDEDAFLNRQISIFFGKLKLTPTQKRKIKEILTAIPFKERFSNSRTSGVVLAGFGEKEYFSSVIEYRVETMVSNILKYRVDHSKIDYTDDSQIRPFAQKEMVQAFIEGIHPEFRNKVQEELGKALSDLPEIIASSLTSLSAKNKELLKKEIRKQTANLQKDLMAELGKFQYENFVLKMLNMVGVLPKDELAMVAESLVNLTSFKRRISLGVETVGGPIDVAIISKNEGFIWMKRKAYLDGEINNKKT